MPTYEDNVARLDETRKITHDLQLTLMQDLGLNEDFDVDPVNTENAKTEDSDDANSDSLNIPDGF